MSGLVARAVVEPEADDRAVPGHWALPSRLRSRDIASWRLLPTLPLRWWPPSSTAAMAREVFVPAFCPCTPPSLEAGMEGLVTSSGVGDAADAFAFVR